MKKLIAISLVLFGLTSCTTDRSDEFECKEQAYTRYYTLSNGKLIYDGGWQKYGDAIPYKPELSDNGKETLVGTEILEDAGFGVVMMQDYKRVVTCK